MFRGNGFSWALQRFAYKIVDNAYVHKEATGLMKRMSIARYFHSVPLKSNRRQTQRMPVLESVLPSHESLTHPCMGVEWRNDTIY